MYVARQQVSQFVTQRDGGGGRSSSIVNYEKKGDKCMPISFQFSSVLCSRDSLKKESKCFKRSEYKFIKTPNGTRDHGKRKRNYHRRMDGALQTAESHLAGSGMAPLLDRPRGRPATREGEREREKESNVSIFP